MSEEITIQEAAQRTGYSTNHLSRLLGEGKIEGRRIGKRLWLVSVDSLQGYADAKHKPGPKGPIKKKEGSASNG
jgi:excisionase family DNA binding protein